VTQAFSIPLYSASHIYKLLHFYKRNKNLFRNAVYTDILCVISFIYNKYKSTSDIFETHCRRHPSHIPYAYYSHHYAPATPIHLKGRGEICFKLHIIIIILSVIPFLGCFVLEFPFGGVIIWKCFLSDNCRWHYTFSPRGFLSALLG